MKQTGKPTVAPPQSSAAPAAIELAKPQPTALAETASTAMAAQAEALVKARMTVALARPRDLDGVRIRLLKECARPGFADAAIYHKPVGDGLEGLSIRFAEAALQLLGNVDIACPVVYDDDEKRIVQVSAMDLETNTAYSSGVTIMKRVERKSLRKNQMPLRTRTNSYGDTIYIVEASDDEILNAQNAQISKMIRTHGLRLVPEWLKVECLTACYETLKKKDAEDPDAARRKLFDVFAEIGVSPEQIKEWLGHEPEQMTAAEKRTLWGIHNAIRDSEATWPQAMEHRARQRAEEIAKAAKAPKPAPKATEKPAPQPATVTPPTAPACDRQHHGDPCADPQCWLVGDREPGQDG